MDVIKGKHVSKMIFYEIGKILNKSEIDCYTAYLKKTFNVNLNLQVFSKAVDLNINHIQHYYQKNNEGKVSSVPKKYFLDSKSLSVTNFRGLLHKYQ